MQELEQTIATELLQAIKDAGTSNRPIAIQVYREFLECIALRQGIPKLK